MFRKLFKIFKIKCNDITNEKCIISANGIRKWYKNNLLHKENGPAIIYLDGSEEWWKYGKKHRLNGPALTMLCVANDNIHIIQEYWENGIMNRIDGPAYIYRYRYNGFPRWYNNTQFHILKDQEIYIAYTGVTTRWIIRGKKYKKFQPQNFLYLQFLIRFLILKKQKSIYDPKNFGGKLIKIDLMKILKKD